MTVTAAAVARVRSLLIEFLATHGKAGFGANTLTHATVDLLSDRQVLELVADWREYAEEGCTPDGMVVGFGEFSSLIDEIDSIVPT